MFVCEAWDVMKKFILCSLALAAAVVPLSNTYQTSTRATGGLGIGLRLVRALANSMEGHYFSSRDNGRVFAVRIAWKNINSSKP